MAVRFELKEILEKKDKSEYWLALETKIRPNTIGDICKNEAQRLSVKNIDAICSALDVDPGDWIKRT